MAIMEWLHKNIIMSFVNHMPVHMYIKYLDDGSRILLHLQK